MIRFHATIKSFVSYYHSERRRHKATVENSLFCPNTPKRKYKSLKWTVYKKKWSANKRWRVRLFLRTSYHPDKERVPLRGSNASPKPACERAGTEAWFPVAAPCTVRYVLIIVRTVLHSYFSRSSHSWNSSRQWRGGGQGREFTYLFILYASFRN